MFTLISDQTAWYLKQSNKLQTVSTQMKMQYPKGRHNVFMSALRGLIFGRNLHHFAMNLGNKNATEKFKKESNAFDTLIKELERKIISNGYKEPFEDGGVYN